jgi:hypothetical protein
VFVCIDALAFARVQAPLVSVSLFSAAPVIADHAAHAVDTKRTRALLRAAQRSVPARVSDHATRDAPASALRRRQPPFPTAPDAAGDPSDIPPAMPAASEGTVGALGVCVDYGNESGSDSFHGVSRGLFEAMVSMLGRRETDFADPGAGQAYCVGGRLGVRIRCLLLHRRAELLVDVVVMLNLGVLVAEADAVASQWAARPMETPTETVAVTLGEWSEPAFLVFYAVEAAAKILVLGPSLYWAHRVNRFDAFVVVVGIGAEMATLLLGRVADVADRLSVLRYTMLFRLLRVLRVLGTVERFNVIFATFLRLIPAFSTLFGVLWAIFVLYAEVGVGLFGGKVMYNSTALAPTLYANSTYFANNFNDFPSALVTLFELLVVNNWHVIMEGLVAVSSPHCRWFVVSFYLFAVVMVVNVVIAYVLDAFFEHTATAPAAAAGGDRSFGAAAQPDVSDLALQSGASFGRPLRRDAEEAGPHAQAGPALRVSLTADADEGEMGFTLLAMGTADVGTDRAPPPDGPERLERHCSEEALLLRAAIAECTDAPLLSALCVRLQEVLQRSGATWLPLGAARDRGRPVPWHIF